MDSQSLQKKTLDEFQHRNKSVQLMREAPLPFQNNLVTLFLSKERRPASQSDIGKYFGPLRIPGTSPIGLRRRNPALFQDTLHAEKEDYDSWIARIIQKMLETLADRNSILTDRIRASETDIIQKISAILEFKSHENIKFCDLIPQQAYEDYLMHMVQVILNNAFDYHESNNYAEFNAICHKIALAALDILHSRGMLSSEEAQIQSLIHIAVLSGYVGVNLKSTASAASTLLNRDLIPIDKKWVKNFNTVEEIPTKEVYEIAQLLIDISSRYKLKYGVDCSPQYHMEVIQSNVPTFILFFTDDYLETLIDVKRFELLLNHNPHLTVLVVPRNGRYGNDFAFSDIHLIETEPIFSGLAPLMEQNRLCFSSHGPKGGAVDPRFLSQGLIKEIDTLSKGKKMILETKGCRNFEMLKGQLSMPWYASFNCNRALSIRTVGIDIDPVFLRIPPGLNAYDGFETPVIGETPSTLTKEVRFAKMTTLDLLTALETGIYQDLLSNFRHESRLNAWLMRLCRENTITIPEVLNSKTFHAIFKTS